MSPCRFTFFSARCHIFFTESKQGDVNRQKDVRKGTLFLYTFFISSGQGMKQRLRDGSIVDFSLYFQTFFINRVSGKTVPGCDPFRQN